MSVLLLFSILLPYFAQQILGQDNDGPIGRADVLHNDLTNRLPGYLEDRLLPDGVSPFFLQEI